MSDSETPEPLFDDAEYGLPPVYPDEHYGEPTGFEVGSIFRWPCSCFRTTHPYSGFFWCGLPCEHLCNTLERGGRGKWVGR